MNEDKQIKSHRDLIAWQKAMNLTVEIYRITKNFPKDELYALTSQIRRCSASIAANIAEGQGRRLSGEFNQFLGNARGSLLELDTHIELAFRVGYINEKQHNNLQEKINEVGRILNGLMRSINC
ncbi:MAG TPA: four helix bundle protein [Pyrinomonadaceae bacterium]|nr:four helix bundle protein [Pyrinomonadaceae bacterium]